MSLPGNPQAPSTEPAHRGPDLAAPARPEGYAIIPAAVRAARGRRHPDRERENLALHALARSLSQSPAGVFDTLLSLAVDMCGGGAENCTAGVSLVVHAEDGTEHFRWVALHGVLDNNKGETTPRHFGPCGECLDRGTSMHYARPDLKYESFQAAGIELTEGLVVPFAAGPGLTPLGTLWIVSHPPKARLFDDEDERLLCTLAAFAAQMYSAIQLRDQLDSAEQVGGTRTADVRKARPRMARIARAVKHLPTAAGTFGLTGGALILLGWAFHIQALKTLFVPGVNIKPNTALGLILCSASLLLLRPGSRENGKRRNMGAGFAISAILLGGVTALQYMLGVDLRLDRLLFANGVPPADIIATLRPSLVAACCILLFGTGLLALRTSARKNSWMADLAFGLTAALALASILWYAYGAIPMTGPGLGIQIALPTAAILFVLSVGAFLLRPESLLLTAVVSHRAGGILAAKLLPFVFLVPLFLGATRVTTFAALHNESVEAAITATLTMFAFAILVWWSASELNAVDVRKEELDRQRLQLRVEAEGEKARAEAEMRTRQATEAAYEELREATMLQRRTDAFLSTALRTLPLGMAFWDTSLRLLRVNNVIAGWSEREPDEFVGKRLEEIAPYVSHFIMPALKSVLATGKAVEAIEFTRPATQGVVRRLRGTVYPVADDSGRVQGVGAVFADVTGEYEQDRALRESNDRYGIVAKATNDAVWDLDLENSTVVWNDSIEALFGYALEEVDPTPHWWEERIHPDDLAPVLDGFRTALEGDALKWEGTYRFRKANGQYASVLDRAYILRDEAGKATRAIGAMSDRTVQDALEASVRHSQKMDAVGRLSAGVAHDFNNVLAVVSMSAEFLLGELGPAGRHVEEVLEIKKAADRGGRLTRQLLAFTRQQILSPVPLALSAVLDEMMGMLQRLIPRDVRLIVENNPGIPPVKVDRGQIEQIVINLVVNACDAMPGGGTLRIATDHFSGMVPGAGNRTAGEYATLSVSDTGMGMSEETIARIFDPFFTTKVVGKGTGLGLATVHGIVKQSDGEISVGSAPGRGSIFTIYLPATKDIGVSVAEPDARQAPPGAATGETILLVEDDPALRKVVERMLVRAGYRVLIAVNGSEALKVGAAHAGRVHLVLTDARMPVMGGAELVQWLVAQKINTKFLVMSGYTDEIEAGLLRSSEAPFIEKPFTSDALLRAVKSAIGS